MKFQTQFSLFKRGYAILSISMAMLSGPVMAQEAATEVIASGGESYKAPSDMLLTWTIGETAIETYSSGSMMLAQGFHQPTICISPLSNSENFTSDISIFPNPTADIININLSNNPSFKNLQTQTVKAELRDLRGRLVHKAEFNSGKYSIDLQEVVNGTYILHLSDADNKQLGSYTIEKIK